MYVVYWVSIVCFTYTIITLNAFSSFGYLEVDLELARKQLDEQQNESLKFNTVHESMESVKNHLQRQLRQRESECSRLVFLLSVHD